MSIFGKFEFWIKKMMVGERTDMKEFCYFVRPGKVNLVASAIMVKNNKILLSKPKNRSYYYPPGGLVEAGEDPKKTCVREVKEELGIKIKVIKPLNSVIRWNINEIELVGDRRDLVIFYYLVEIISGKEKLIKSADIGATEKFVWAGVRDLKKYKVYPEMGNLFKEVLLKNKKIM